MGAGKRGGGGKGGGTLPRSEDDPPPAGGGGMMARAAEIMRNAAPAANAAKFRPAAGMSEAVARSAANLGRGLGKGG